MTTYGNVLRSLLPPGPAWSAEPGSEFMNLLDALGDSLAVVDARALALLEEFDPRTTTELLSDWERVFGLPGNNPTPPGMNLFYNPDFEIYTNPAAAPDGWISWYPVAWGGTSTAARIAGRTGTYASRITCTNDTSIGVWTTTSAPTWLPYRSYVISWWARLGPTPGNAVGSTGGLAWTVVPASTTPIANPVLSTEWQRYSFRIVWGAAVEADGYAFLVGATFGVGAAQIDMDDLQVVAGDTEYSERQAALWAKMLGYGDPTPAFFESLAAGLGYLAIVTYARYPVFVAGSPTGAPIYDRRWAFLWTMYRLAGALDSTLAWLVGTVTPDHTQVKLNAPVWTECANAKNIFLSSVAYGNGIWVAVGAADGADAYIIRSVDGVNWYEQVNPKNCTLYSIAYGNGQFVAVGVADGADAYIVTSPDGITWTEQTNPKNKTLYNVKYYDGLWVVVGAADGADAYIVTSPNGIAWTEQINPKNISLLDVHHDNGLWVAVGSADGADAYLLTSTDGVVWVERSNPKNLALYSVAYGVDTWVAVGKFDGTDSYIVTSPDGITWTEQTNPKNKTLYNVKYYDGLWIAVGEADGTDAYVVLSHDGVTWIEWPNPKNVVLYSVACGHRRWVAVGAADGVDGYLITL